HTAQLVGFAGHAQTETLESTFHILEKLSKTKLAVQAWLNGGKIPYCDRRLSGVHLNQQHGFAGLGTEVSRQRAGDESIRQRPGKCGQRYNASDGRSFCSRRGCGTINRRRSSQSQLRF